MFGMIDFALPFVAMLTWNILKNSEKSDEVIARLGDYISSQDDIPTVDLLSMEDSLSEDELKCISFDDMKKDMLNAIESVNIFLSYSWKDETLADKIEVYFKDTNVSIRRDKNNIEHWGSIREYMDTIHDTDYVILIISDAYLKSVNCMYEINELVKDENYKSRMFPLVIEESIYQFDGRIAYITYWEKKYEEAKQKAGQVRSVENQSKISKDLHLFREISHSVSEFFDIVCDMNNPDPKEWFDSIAKRLTETHEAS